MDKEQCRRTIGWRKGMKVILFNAGRSPSLKGLPLAREAAGLAEQMVGPLELFELHGETSPKQIPLYLNAADCLLLTSQFEGSPNIVKEAMACNLPVVSVDVGDVAERLKGVHPSCIVARDPAEIAKAVESVLALGVRSNGREHVAHLSEAEIARKICSIYNSVVYSRQKANTPTTANDR
jgi:glycosyltransferase involved in cell wall biosynthesis